MSGTIMGEFTGSLTSGTFGVIIAGTSGVSGSDVSVKLGSTNSSPHPSSSLVTIGSSIGSGSERPYFRLKGDNSLRIGYTTGSIDNDGSLILGRLNNTFSAGANRQFKMGYDGDFYFCLGDFGNNESIFGPWKRQFAIHYDAPEYTLKADNLGNMSAAGTFTTGAPNTWTTPQAASETLLESTTGSCEINFSTSNNFYITLKENTNFIASAGSLLPGQSGIITILQDNSSAFTISFSSDFMFASGSDKTMSTGLSSISVLAYSIQGSSLTGNTFIISNLIKDIQ